MQRNEFNPGRIRAPGRRPIHPQHISVDWLYRRNRPQSGIKIATIVTTPRRVATPRRRPASIAPQGHLYLHHYLDSGVKPRNDNGRCCVFIFTNIVPSFILRTLFICLLRTFLYVSFRGLTPESRSAMSRAARATFVTTPRPRRGHPGHLVCGIAKKTPRRGVFYIIPGIPPPIPGLAGFSSGISDITQPVVRIAPAVDAAAWIAVFTTLAGSIMPADIISTYSPVWAL